MANQKQYWQFEIFGTDPDLIGFFGDAGVIIPSGTTAERPVAPAIGHMRFNTDLGQFEGYNGGWLPFATGSATNFDSLTDTPANKTGSANRVMIVNSPETDIEYSSALLLENTGRLRVPAAYETLVDADTVITNKKYVDDQDNLQLSLSGGLMTGGITMGSNAILGLPLTPTSNNEATSKGYVDGLFAGIDRKESVNLSTTADLNTETGDSWVAAGTKVGKTLTSDANTATIDGIAVANGDRVLVRSQTSAIDNGIYDVSGVGGAAVVFTRSTDTDGSPSHEVNGGATTFVVFGSTLDLTQWSVVATGDVDVDVDSMVWTQTGASPDNFLELSGGTMTGSITMGAAGIQMIGNTTTAIAPAYAFVGDLGTGLHQTAGASTMSMVIGTTATWNYSATAITPAADVTQDIGSAGLKMRNVYADNFLPNFGAVGDPSYSFEGATTTGMYNNGAGGVRFAVGGSNALNIESDGTISVDTATYETLVLADNDVPNKKYVDDSIGAIATNAISDADGDTSVDVETAADDDTIRFDTGDSPVGFPAATNTMTLASSGLSVTLPTANVATTAGAPITLTAGAGNTTGAGGTISITAGAGGATGDGGDIIINAGDGGSTNDQGGQVFIEGGMGDDGLGGNVNITGGTGHFLGRDGADVIIIGGDGDYGGSVIIHAGMQAISTNYGGKTGKGNIELTASPAYYDGSYTGGEININGGSALYASPTAGQRGGPVNITGGQSYNYGGEVNITGGDGDPSGNGDGGDITITAGQGPTSDDDGRIILATTRTDEVEVIRGYAESGVTGAATTLMTIPIPSNDSAIFEVSGIARAESAGSAGFRIFGVVVDGGGAAIVGSTTTDTSNSGGAAADWNLSVGTSGANLLVITDNDAETVDWKIKVRLTSINVPGA